MLDFDHWREIWHALTSNKLRTLLTAFGVFWGVFMLIIMMGSGTGLENGVSAGFAGEATNSFFVWTRLTSKPFRGLPAGRRFNLDNTDTEAIRREVPEVSVIAPRNQLQGFGGDVRVVRGAESHSFNVMGDYPEIRKVQAVRLSAGRFLNPIDMEQRRKVAVIGTRVRQALFEPDEDPIGDHIQVNGVYFRVVGLFRTRQTGDRADQDTQTVYIPFTTFQRAFNYGDRVGWFAIVSQDDVPASEAETAVLELLRRRHKIHPEDERALGHYNQEIEFNRVQGLFAGIRALIWIVGIGTLSAGAIGVSNIMLVIVRERTKEIGVRRALGAKPLGVMGQIVFEAILLTAVAGYVGLIVGMALVELFNWMMPGGAGEMFRSPDVGLVTALQALAVLVVAGTLAGIIPAQRAVRVRPVQALRAD